MADRKKPGQDPKQEGTAKRTLADKARGHGRKSGAKHPKLAMFLASRGWRVYGPGGCLVALALVVFCTGLILDGVWTRRLDDLEADLKSRAEIAEAEAKRNQEASDDGTGAAQPVGPVEYVGETDPARRAEDDRIVMDMVSHATTWSSRQEYEESRQELLRHYDWLNMNTNAEFLSSFFPPGDDLYIKLDGVVVGDTLADGRNITFESMVTYLLGEDPDATRHYLAEAVVQSSGQVGGTAQARVAVTYDTHSDGSVWNLKCYSV